MATSHDPPAQEEVLEPIRAAVPGLISVYQFGSTVRDNEHSESDLDLAVLAAQPLPNLERWELQEDLAVRLRRTVDLVDLRAASTVMQVQVIAQGDILVEEDRTARQRFEMNTFSSYALLNEERAGIIEDIQARGRVYGR